MITVKRHVRPDEIRQSAKHKLFVEGKNNNSIDSIVLSNLLKSIIRIETMGASYHIRSVAKALYKSHPDYYFLIDRDHYDEGFVNKCWNNFPDPATHNLLVWFRREIENYFLIPEYLLQSKWITASEDQIRQYILEGFSKRLYLDTANQVIIHIRETLKENWIKLFDKAADFGTKDAALSKLSQVTEFSLQKKKVLKLLKQDKIRSLFIEHLDKMTGGKEKLEYGYGQWLELLKGKEVLQSVINACFKVKDAKGNFLQGDDKIEEVVKELAKKTLDKQPEDFKRLHQLISDRIRPN